MSETTEDDPVIADADTTGPPFTVVIVGILSLLVSCGLAFALRTVPSHLIGYATGAVIPVLVIGIARRVDLDRRSDPGYRSNAAFRTGLLVLGVGAVVAAGLHIWPLATEFAS